VYVSLISAERDSAVIRIAFRDESRKVTIRREPATEVPFDADAVKMSISLGKTTVAPFALGDLIFNLPVAVHKLDTSKSPIRIAQQRVLATGTITPHQAGRVRTLLTGNEYLSLHGSDCFDPGMEFVYG